MSSEMKMFCNICGKEFNAEEMMEVSVDNEDIELRHMLTCNVCGEKALFEQRKAMHEAFLKDYRPFTPDEALIRLPGKEVRTTGNTARYIVTAVNGDKVLTGDKWLTLGELLADYWFIYGGPCGEKVEK